MDLKIDAIVRDCLSALVYTQDDSIQLYEHQLSQLSESGRNYYSNFLKNELSESKIDKLLEEAYKYDFKNVVLIREPFIKVRNLNEVEIYNANSEFINTKRSELIQIFDSLTKKKKAKKSSIEDEKVNTYSWRSSIDALNILHRELIEYRFIPDIDFEIFKVAFSGGYTEKPLNIPWINVSRKKLSNKASLLYLLNELHPKFINFPYDMRYETIMNLFCDRDNNSFKDMKQSVNNFNKSGYNDKKNKKILDEIISKIENLPQK